MSKVSQLKQDLRQMTVEQLQSELLVLRKTQFDLRLKAVNGVLTKTHLKTAARKTIARIKTMISEKAVES